MNNHYFAIGGEIYRQKDGSPIGLDMSVEGASLYMSIWDHKFLDRLKRLGISVLMYKRYVDDIIMVMNGIEKGWVYCKNRKKMVLDHNNPLKDMAEDARTFSILREIANEIDVNIQMEVDVCSWHEDGRLPVLDLGMFVANDCVEYSFYRKPVNSPFQILYRSALNNQTKRASLLQEGLRRLRNTSSCISDAEKSQILTRFMWSLKISGYDHIYRHRLHFTQT